MLVNGPDRGLGRPRATGWSASTSRSATRPPCAGSHSGSPPRPGGGWTTRDLRSTPGCPAACGCTPCCRRSSPAGTAAQPAGACAAATFTLGRARGDRARWLPGSTGVAARSWSRRGWRSSSPVAPAPARRPCWRACSPWCPPPSAWSWSRTPASSRRSTRTSSGSRRGCPTPRARALSTCAMLVRQALRMRPDRLVVGEVRGAEVVELLAALNTGHDGGCGTVHAIGRRRPPGPARGAGGWPPGCRELRCTASSAAGVQAVVHLERPGGARTGRPRDRLPAPRRRRAGPGRPRAAGRRGRTAGRGPRGRSPVGAARRIGDRVSGAACAAVGLAAAAGSCSRPTRRSCCAGCRPRSPHPRVGSRCARRRGRCRLLPHCWAGAVAGSARAGSSSGRRDPGRDPDRRGSTATAVGRRHGGPLAVDLVTAPRRRAARWRRSRGPPSSAPAVRRFTSVAAAARSPATDPAARAADGRRRRRVRAARGPRRGRGRSPTRPAPVWPACHQAGRDRRAADAVRRELDAALAGPRATAALLSMLPVAGVLMGSALGADPVAFLVSVRRRPGHPAGRDAVDRRRGGLDRGDRPSGRWTVTAGAAAVGLALLAGLLVPQPRGRCRPVGPAGAPGRSPGATAPRLGRSAGLAGCA